jgi:nicotinamidase-related amidase
MTVSGEDARAGREALLLIDFQNDFLVDHGRLPVARNQVAGVIAATNTALAEALSAGTPVAAVGNAFRRNDWLGNFFRHKAALVGSWGARWDMRVPIDGLPYFRKWASDAFVNPALEPWLKDQGVSRVALAGLFAKACLSATAKGALDRGFQVRVLAAASACSSDASRTAALARLERLGARIERPEPLSAF